MFSNAEAMVPVTAAALAAEAATAVTEAADRIAKTAARVHLAVTDRKITGATGRKTKTRVVLKALINSVRKHLVVKAQKAVHSTRNPMVSVHPVISIKIRTVNTNTVTGQDKDRAVINHVHSTLTAASRVQTKRLMLGLHSRLKAATSAAMPVAVRLKQRRNLSAIK
jgi:hypothetical protein